MPGLPRRGVGDTIRISSTAWGTQLVWLPSLGVAMRLSPLFSFRGPLPLHGGLPNQSQTCHLVTQGPKKQGQTPPGVPEGTGNVRRGDSQRCGSWWPPGEQPTLHVPSFLREPNSLRYRGAAGPLSTPPAGWLHCSLQGGAGGPHVPWPYWSGLLHHQPWGPKSFPLDQLEGSRAFGSPSSFTYEKTESHLRF